ncbi:MAG TPA: type VI secretion protein IcmF/TssM N-terminal domain-containing protein, partial [Polyangiaceae bacterium]
VEELLARLDMVLPMYVVFTKADLIGGFIEFWGDLTNQERGQVWGATFALDDERLADPTEAFGEEFELLVRSVHARMLTRLPHERITGARTRVLQFPAEFRALGTPLGRFIGELCQPSPYRDTTIFRGFYFTSGTQVGRPFDRVLSGMLSGFGLGDRLGGESPEASQPRSYFVTDLFKTVIFPDRNAAIRSGKWLRSVAHRQILLAVGALVSALVVIVPSLVGYAENRDLVTTTARQIAGVPGDDARIAGAAARLDSLLDRVQDLEKRKTEFSVRGWWGPYAATALYEPVHRLYADRLRSIIEGPLRQQVVGDVHAVDGVVRLDDPENFWAAYDDVKLFVLMTSPAQLDATKSGKSELVDFAVQHLADKWARTTGAGSAPELERLRLHCRYYVDVLVRDRTWAWPADDATLAAARNRLNQQSLEALQYSWLLHGTRSAQPIRPDQIFIGAAATYVSSRAPAGVPGAYTREGWNAVKASLGAESSQFALEPWVLGAGGTRPASMARLREMYFDKYVRAWRDLLTNLVVSTPTSIEDAIAELRALDGAENGPYTGLFRTLTANARLDMAPTGLAAQLAEKAKGALGAVTGKLLKADAGTAEPAISLVEDRLTPLIRFGVGETARPGAPSPPSSLLQCLEELRTLEVKLGQLRESKTEPTGELEESLARTSGTVERLLAGLDGSTRLLVEPLLMNPIRGSRAGVASSSHGALGDKWKADVWTAYDAKIAPRYPFADAPDIAIADFVEF